MAYGDYSGGGISTSMPVRPDRQAIQRPPMMPAPGGGLMPGMPEAEAQPAPPGGALPTNTRQQNLQQVQAAYAQPRMPGDMGALNGLISQSSSPVSASDPIMAGAFGAGRVADQRNIDRQRAALAEQLGSQGMGDSGAMNTRTGAIQQRVGESQALRESGMLYDEGNARRNALLQALGLDQSRYAGDNDIGMRIAALEAMLNNQAVQPFF